MARPRPQQRRRIRKPVKLEGEIVLTYKNVGLLKRLISEQGAIMSREESGLTQKQQRLLSKAVKRARHLALLPFTQTL